MTPAPQLPPNWDTLVDMAVVIGELRNQLAQALQRLQELEPQPEEDLEAAKAAARDPHAGYPPPETATEKEA